MKNQMLILKGPSSVGKSTTIKLAFDKFLKSTVQKKRTTVHYLYLSKKEVGAVIEVGSHRVGIASRGDTKTHVKSGLSFFSSHKCNVVICATRSRGKPLVTAQDFSLKKLGISPTEWPKVRNIDASGQNAANKKMACALVRWLKVATR